MQMQERKIQPLTAGHLIHDAAGGVRSIQNNGYQPADIYYSDSGSPVGVVLNTTYNIDPKFIPNDVEIALFGGGAELTYPLQSDWAVYDYLLNGVKVTSGSYNMQVMRIVNDGAQIRLTNGTITTQAQGQSTIIPDSSNPKDSGKPQNNKDDEGA